MVQKKSRFDPAGSTFCVENSKLAMLSIVKEPREVKGRYNSIFPVEASWLFCQAPVPMTRTLLTAIAPTGVASAAYSLTFVVCAIAEKANSMMVTNNITFNCNIFFMIFLFKVFICVDFWFSTGGDMVTAFELIAAVDKEEKFFIYLCFGLFLKLKFPVPHDV